MIARSHEIVLVILEERLSHVASENVTPTKVGKWAGLDWLNVSNLVASTHRIPGKCRAIPGQATRGLKEIRL